MLDGFPTYRYFYNGNGYSGSHGGMRYFLEPIKVQPPEDKGEKRISFRVTLWPEPWSLEHTAPEKITVDQFEGGAWKDEVQGQEVLDRTVAWIKEQYTAQAERWKGIPSILDCEPYQPPESQDEGE